MENLISEAAPLSQLGFAGLRLSEDQISQEVTEGYFDLHPECYDQNPQRVKEMCKSDLKHHLNFLYSSLLTDSPEIFADYCFWLRDVLRNYNLSLQHPIDSLTLLRQAILKQLEGADQLVVNRVMDAGIDALRSEQPFLYGFEKSQPSVGSACEQYSQSLIEGNRRSAEGHILSFMENGGSLVDASVEIIQPAMYEIGRLWSKNRLTVAQEHLATAISQNALARAYAAAIFDDPIDRTALFACVEGNHHSLGLRMVSDAYESKGWDSKFIGADTPTRAIISEIESSQPDVVALSLSMPDQLLSLQQVIQAIDGEYGGKAPAIVIGGLFFNNHRSLSGRLRIDACYGSAKEAYEDL